MTVIKAGDKLERTRDVAGDLPVGTIVTVKEVLTGMMYQVYIEGYEGLYLLKNFRKVSNTQPHVHCDLIKQWADGAIIEYKSNEIWYCSKIPMWNGSAQYRVKPEKCNAEAIARIEGEMRKLADELKDLK